MTRFDRDPHRIALPIPFGWYCVGYGDELAPGELRSVRYFGADWVLYRRPGGEVGLAAAHCPHLGAHLGHGGRVEDQGLRCPFHGWLFGAQGEVVDIPYAEKIPPLAREPGCLHHIPVREQNEFLFAWYHPAGVAPTFELEPFAELDSGDWTLCRRRDWIIQTHVQETGENAVDTAHFRAVHNTGELETKVAVRFEGPRRHSIISVHHQRIDVAGPVREKKTEAVAGEIHSVNVGPGQTWNRNHGIDLLMIGLPTPVEAEVLEFRFACSVPRGKAQVNAKINDLIFANAFEQVDQDIPIWENKRYCPRPILCEDDGPIAEYRAWFRQFYADPPGPGESSQRQRRVKTS